MLADDLSNLEATLEESKASRRAKATKSRLDDLESEMRSFNDKQSERNKRKENLRKMLNSIE